LFRLTRHAGTAPITDVGPYKAAVTNALNGPLPRSLYFPAHLEELFEFETQQSRSSHLVVVGIIWIAFGVLAAVALSGGSGPAPFGMHPAVRLGLVTPILIAVVVAVWWGVRPFIRELLVMLACIIAPASMMLGVIFTPGTDLGTNRGALTIILLFITVVVRLRFWFAATACFVLVALQVGAPWAMHLPVPGNVVLMLITISVTLVANYALEREQRLHYLQRLHGRIQGNELAAMVEQLHDLSQRDALTGLANRRALDALLAELSARNEPYAVILVDIDSFKAFNDCYGHQIGDDALRRVAAMLRASLRFTTDRIARMGGEEFAVILPNTPLDAARTMAERMRKSVHELQIPHKGSPTGTCLTISAGVSTSSGKRTSAEIVDEADKALYRAKMSGRNRVEVAGLDSAARPSRLAISA
jgi:diguanylate cyclase (GGDEF)-like protein